MERPVCQVARGRAWGDGSAQELSGLCSWVSLEGESRREFQASKFTSTPPGRSLACRSCPASTLELSLPSPVLPLSFSLSLHFASSCLSFPPSGSLPHVAGLLRSSESSSSACTQASSPGCCSASSRINSES
eukprot:758103-Hanusia_phi.AAC.4